MKIKNIWYVLLVIMTLTACSGPVTATPAAVPPTPVPPTALPPTEIPPAPSPTVATAPTGWSEELLKNSVYLAPMSGTPITLSNGRYEGGTDANRISVVLDSHIAFGDMNNDGQEDAVALLTENTGGTGVFYYLTVLINLNGAPVQAASILIDDRPIIENLELEDTKIHLSAVIHGPSDPMINPTLHINEIYTFKGNRLDLIHMTSRIGDSEERSITFTSPQPGEQVDKTVQIQGNMPIAPFENTLLYGIYDTDGNLLEEGGFMVNAEDMGKPATFDNPITLPDLPSGTVIWFELSELSMADGSTLTLERLPMVIR